MGDKL